MLLSCTFVRLPFGFKVTGVYHDSFYQSSICDPFSCNYKSVVHLLYAFSEKTGGGVMDLVYGSSSSSYMAFYVFFQ